MRLLRALCQVAYTTAVNLAAAAGLTALCIVLTGAAVWLFYSSYDLVWPLYCALVGWLVLALISIAARDWYVAARKLMEEEENAGAIRD